MTTNQTNLHQCDDCNQSFLSKEVVFHVDVHDVHILTICNNCTRLAEEEAEHPCSQWLEMNTHYDTCAIEATGVCNCRMEEF